jgi:hypothetical protein
LGSPLQPPLVAFDTPLCALIGCLEWRPSTVTRGRLPVVLDKNGPNHVLTRGVPGGNVEQLIHGLWLIAAELMHQALVVHAVPECRDDVGVTDLWELVALLGETPDVIPLGFTLLLLAILQILGAAQLHVCALKVTGEDLLQNLLAIDQVSGQVIEPGPGRVSQVNGEELDDEEVVIRPACPARKAVVHQPNVGVDFAIVFDDIIRCLKKF